MTILEVLIPENFSSLAKWEHSAFMAKSLPETSLKLSILCLEANNCASGEDSLARHAICMFDVWQAFMFSSQNWFSRNYPFWRSL